MSESIPSAGQTFSLILERPQDPPTNTTLRQLPLLPYNTVADYTIISGLQVGHEFDTEVWLAQPQGSQNSPIVLKFFITSLMDPLMLSNPNAGVDRTVNDIAMCQRAAFDALWDLQGTAIPWFFGLHEVSVSDEIASLLVMEYIPHSFDTIPQYFQPCDEDIDRYINWFKTTVKALDTAHSRQILHHDIRPSNLRHDTTQVVLIDWMNDIHHFKCFVPTDPCFPVIDFQELLDAFASVKERIGKEFFLKVLNDAELGQRVRKIYGL
ncbi:hypothetical protein VNI00_004493 [Paramarasmius palmivorus]|uniref:Protein kinase domain-containing protein n=1 Tax=Paramarasmius palmivorus TaxID=297713 RepID=A0AAW0DKG3_9AGAR